MLETVSVERDPEQVGRETEVDCALAELYVRSLATERLVKDTAHSEIFNSIFTRMTEVGLCTSRKPSPLSRLYRRACIVPFSAA